jgi:hypothetical protein
MFGLVAHDISEFWSMGIPGFLFSEHIVCGRRIFLYSEQTFWHTKLAKIEVEKKNQYLTVNVSM